MHSSAPYREDRIVIGNGPFTLMFSSLQLGSLYYSVTVLVLSQFVLESLISGSVRNQICMKCCTVGLSMVLECMNCSR